MAGEWRELPLGELVENFDAQRIPLSSREREKRRGPFPYYGATGVIDYVDDFLFEGLHLLVAEDGSVERSDGKPFLQLVDGQFWVNNHAHVLRGRTDQDTKYLYYALSTVAIRPYMSGSVQAKLSQANLNRILTPYPTRETERHAIAHILGTLDDKIELNRRMCRTLEGIARAIFRSWFVDFEPVRAKAAGAKSFRGMPQAIFNTLPAAFTDSPLGPIPKGWTVRGLDEIARFQNGLALQKYPPGGGPTLPAIKIAQLRAGHTEGADQASANIDPAYIVADGDVLFSWSGSLECVLWAGGAGALNQHLFKVTSDRFPKWFCYRWIHAHLDHFRHIAAAKATTMGHIQRHHLSEAKVVVPPADVLRGADRYLGPLIDAVPQKLVHSRTLAAIRDALLPKLVSGEIRVGRARRAAAIG